MTDFREMTLGEVARRFAEKFGLNEAEVLAEFRHAGLPDTVGALREWSSASKPLNKRVTARDIAAEVSRIDAENLRQRVPPIKP